MSAASSQASTLYDTIIRNGTVIDGRRAPRYRADVGLQGDRIAAVGDLREATCGRTVDAAGQIVAPGFIDVHNHSDGWLLARPHLAAKTLQGFTSEVLMADGISYAPVNPHTAREWLFYLRALDGLTQDELERLFTEFYRAHFKSFGTILRYSSMIWGSPDSFRRLFLNAGKFLRFARR